jgi:hypothetical protein
MHERGEARLRHRERQRERRQEAVRGEGGEQRHLRRGFVERQAHQRVLHARVRRDTEDAGERQQEQREVPPGRLAPLLHRHVAPVGGPRRRRHGHRRGLALGVGLLHLDHQLEAAAGHVHMQDADVGEAYDVGCDARDRRSPMLSRAGGRVGGQTMKQSGT